MNMKLEIDIKKGLGDITFGMPVEKVMDILGAADEVENIDNAIDETTTVLRYTELGMTIFCEGDEPCVTCIDIANDECTLFGEEVFGLKEKEVVALMVKNNYYEQDVDNEAWGERRITFYEGNIDFFFEHDTMTSITFGA